MALAKWQTDANSQNGTISQGNFMPPAAGMTDALACFTITAPYPIRRAGLGGTKTKAGASITWGLARLSFFKLV